MEPIATPSTDGAWLVALFLETILYGIGLLQTWLYFRWAVKDGWSIKLPVRLSKYISFEPTQLMKTRSSSSCRLTSPNAPFLILPSTVSWRRPRSPSISARLTSVLSTNSGSRRTISSGIPLHIHLSRIRTKRILFFRSDSVRPPPAYRIKHSTSSSCNF